MARDSVTPLVLSAMATGHERARDIAVHAGLKTKQVSRCLYNLTLQGVTYKTAAGWKIAKKEPTKEPKAVIEKGQGSPIKAKVAPVQKEAPKAKTIGQVIDDFIITYLSRYVDNSKFLQEATTYTDKRIFELASLNEKSNAFTAELAETMADMGKTISGFQDAIKKLQADMAEMTKAAAVKHQEQSSKPPKQPELKDRRKQLIRICVANLLPAQAGVIASEFGETFDIAFWNGKTGSGIDQLKSAVDRCDAVFWHTAHSSHQNFEIANRRPEKVIKVPGGMTPMKKALLKYYEEHVK